MTTNRSARPLLASTPFIAIALASLALAAQTPRPAVLPPAPATSAPRTPPSDSFVAPVPRATIVQPPMPRVSARTPAVVAQPSVPAPHPITSREAGFPTRDEVFSWIRRYHPDVAANNSRLNAVMIVVDSFGRYIASTADSVSIDDTSPANWTFEQLRILESVVRSTPQAVFIVNGVRSRSIDSVDASMIRNIEVVKGEAATAKYGPEAANGAVIIQMKAPDSDAFLSFGFRRDDPRLMKLGLSATDIGEVMSMRIREGVVGPNRTYVAVLQRKSGAK